MRRKSARKVSQLPAVRSERVDELLGMLRNASEAAPATAPAPLERLSEEATSHADALRATLAAQHKAEEMLSAAGVARREASEQAEQILAEAEESAERLNVEAQRHLEAVRRTSTDWAANQRGTVEALVTELIASANEDAEAIRADALTTAMAEAEEAAQRYLGAATERAERAAEEIRDEAREVLARSRALLGEAQDAVNSMATTLSGFLGGLVTYSEAIDGLLLEAADLPGDSDQGAEEADRDRGQGEEVEDVDDASPPFQGRPLGSLFRGSDNA